MLAVGWCVASYFSFTYMQKQQSEALYCGTMVGRYSSSSKSSAPNYFLFKMPDYTAHIYGPSIAQNNDIGDRLCIRTRYMDVYGSPGGPTILAMITSVVNGLLLFCLLCFGLFKAWEFLGRLK